jgi:uncharacterized protein
MYKIVLDANVFVSAVIKGQSNPGRILDLVRKEKALLVLSPDILLEIATVLTYPKLRKIHGLSLKEIKSHVKRLESISKTVIPAQHIDIIKEDPSDNIYLECAVEGEADFIISGDHHLTDLKSYAGVRIVNPAAFLTILQNDRESEG